MNFPSLRKIKELSIKPKKSLGQVFLIDRYIAKKIVSLAGIKLGDYVVEVGAGVGALTFFLVQDASCVFAIEKDQVLCDILKKIYYEYDNNKVVMFACPLFAEDLGCSVYKYRPRDCKEYGRIKNCQFKDARLIYDNLND